MFGSYEERMISLSATGGIAPESFSTPTKNSESLGKEVKSYSESKTEELRKIIYEKVTKNTHRNKSPKDGRTIKQCIELFNKGADPNVLITLEELLSKWIELKKSPKEKEEYQKYYNYYTEKFLPALKTKVIESEELMKPSVLNNEEKSSQKSPTIKGKILKIISEITGITNKSSDKNYSSSIIQNQKSRKNNQTDRQDNATLPLS